MWDLIYDISGLWTLLCWDLTAEQNRGVFKSAVLLKTKAHYIWLVIFISYIRSKKKYGLIFFPQTKHEMWEAAKKSGGCCIPVRSAAWLLATRYGKYLLKTLCRRKHKPEKTNEVLKRVPVERRCISRDAPSLQLLCYALILLSPTGNHYSWSPVWGNFWKRHGSQWCLGSLRDRSLWLHRVAVAAKQRETRPATTGLHLAAFVENKKYHFYI